MGSTNMEKLNHRNRSSPLEIQTAKMDISFETFTRKTSSPSDGKPRNTRSPFRKWHKMQNVGTLHHHCYRNHKGKALSKILRTIAEKAEMENATYSELIQTAQQLSSSRRHRISHHPTSTNMSAVISEEQSSRLLYFLATLSLSVLVVCIIFFVVIYAIKRQELSDGNTAQDSDSDSSQDEDEDESHAEEMDTCLSNDKPDPVSPHPSLPSLKEYKEQQAAEEKGEQAIESEIRESINIGGITSFYEPIKKLIHYILFQLKRNGSALANDYPDDMEANLSTENANHGCNEDDDGLCGKFTRGKEELYEETSKDSYIEELEDVELEIGKPEIVSSDVSFWKRQVQEINVSTN